MNDDAIDEIIEFCKKQIHQCEIDNVQHKGGNVSAIETYEKVIEMLTDLKD